MEKGQKSRQRSRNPNSSISTWSVQCDECFKWRVIPTQEEFEEIRSNVIDDPFICSKKQGVSCDDPVDIEYDSSRTWIIDKPNLPKTPPGFKRTLQMRRDFSKLDCYYEAPVGKRLRSIADVAKFLEQNPEYKDGVSELNFSFAKPKIMEETLPADVVAMKERSA